MNPNTDSLGLAFSGTLSLSYSIIYNRRLPPESGKISGGAMRIGEG